ncbi:hypothetical protein V1512DRAFT_201535 [Lipomyces arxii]|uniref:uncharacterized protein n=1 Tax=Lipomyces arxii TaxID=56418 RepID=UPI0034CF7C17
MNNQTNLNSVQTSTEANTDNSRTNTTFTAPSISDITAQVKTMLQTEWDGSSTPHIVTARDKKYDRQLRLWAANGQAALEEAHVLLLTASAAGAEILKNLVLPGAGTFTVADDKDVTENDVDVNFFLESDSIGKPRAEQLVEYLQELNADTTGHAQIANLKALDGLDPSYWESFSMVVAYQIRPSVLQNVAKVLWEKNIPLLVANSIGFYAYARIVVPEHTVVESHPESTFELRLDCPWPELERYVESIEIEKLGETDYQHVPYIVLLLNYLKRWQTENGAPPSTYAEKNKFKDLVKTGIRYADSENFDEALGAVLREVRPTTISSSVMSIFNDPRAQKLNATSTKFWILTRAVADFVASPVSGGHLPLPGTLPDMKADSKTYIVLQTIYRKKAKEDQEWVANRVSEILSSLGLPSDSISEDEIETFCKFAGHIVVQNGRSIEEEYTPDLAKSKLILTSLTEENSLMHVYLGFRAVEMFEERMGRFPGALDDTEADETTLADIALELVKSWGGEALSDYTLKVVKEFVRSGGGELHNISSLIGGIGAQEIVKLITGQYVPVNNTVIFDGIISAVDKWEL